MKREKLTPSSPLSAKEELLGLMELPPASRRGRCLVLLRDFPTLMASFLPHLIEKILSLHREEREWAQSLLLTFLSSREEEPGRLESFRELLFRKTKNLLERSDFPWGKVSWKSFFSLITSFSKWSDSSLQRWGDLSSQIISHDPSFLTYLCRSLPLAGFSPSERITFLLAFKGQVGSCELFRFNYHLFEPHVLNNMEPLEEMEKESPGDLKSQRPLRHLVENYLIDPPSHLPPECLAYALWRWGNFTFRSPLASEKLIEYLHWDHWEVQMYAAWVMGRVKNNGQPPPSRLFELAASSPWRVVRKWALWALAEIGTSGEEICRIVEKKLNDSSSSGEGESLQVMRLIGQGNTKLFWENVEVFEEWMDRGSIDLQCEILRFFRALLLEPHPKSQEVSHLQREVDRLSRKLRHLLYPHMRFQKKVENLEKWIEKEVSTEVEFLEEATEEVLWKPKGEDHPPEPILFKKINEKKEAGREWLPGRSDILGPRPSAPVIDVQAPPRKSRGIPFPSIDWGGLFEKLKGKKEEKAPPRPLPKKKKEAPLRPEEIPREEPSPKVKREEEKEPTIVLTESDDDLRVLDEDERKVEKRDLLFDEGEERKRKVDFDSYDAPAEVGDEEVIVLTDSDYDREVFPEEELSQREILYEEARREGLGPLPRKTPWAERHFGDETGRPGMVERLAAKSRLVLKSIQVTIGLKFLMVAHAIDNTIDAMASYIRGIFNAWRLARAAKRKGERHRSDNEVESILEDLAHSRFYLSRIFGFAGFSLERGREIVPGSLTQKGLYGPTFALELVIEARGKLDDMKEDLTLLTAAQIRGRIQTSAIDFIKRFFPNPLELIAPWKDFFLMAFFLDYSRADIEDMYGDLLHSYQQLKNQMAPVQKEKKEGQGDLPKDSDKESLEEISLALHSYEAQLIKTRYRQPKGGSQRENYKVEESIEECRKSLQRLLRLLINPGRYLDPRRWDRLDLLEEVQKENRRGAIHPIVLLEWEKWLTRQVRKALREKGFESDLQEKKLRKRESLHFLRRRRLARNLHSQFLF